MSQDPVRHADTIIFPASLDPKAVSVVRRLHEAGYESYLVGGCVRDLLLGHIPKDFDVSTEARPRQIRRVFRNCRVIGRRFKLAHVHFGEQIIEVATFRRNPSESDSDGDGGDDDRDADSDDLLITRDNEYGTAQEDTVRRDFTINALLYDVLTDEVIDYVGGVEDIGHRILRTIGDPAIRLAEDPVRMLRAVKFTARLGLNLEPGLDAAMREHAELITRSAPPRVLEEIYKLLTCGRAGRALEMLLEFGLLEQLMPELADHWRDRPEALVRLGEALDRVDRAQRRVGNAFLLAMLFHDVWREQLEGEERVDPLLAARELLAPAAQRMNIPRRDVSTAAQMLLNQSRLERTRRGRRFRMADFLARETTVQAIDLLYVRCLAGLADDECHARWALRLVEARGVDEMPGAPAQEEAASDDGDDRPRKRRRRGGRRRSSSRRRGGRGRGSSDDGERARDDDPRSEDAPTDDDTARDDGEARDDERTDEDGAPRRKRSRRGRGGRGRRGTSTAGEADADGSPADDEPSDDAEPAAAGDTDEAPARPAPRAATSTGAATEPTEARRGLRGRVRALLRKVIGTPDEGEAASFASTDGAPTAPLAEASAEAAHAADSEPAETEDTPAPRSRRRPAPRDEGAEEPADATTDEPAETGGSADDDSDDRTSDRPRRRRRGGRRRSRRGSGSRAAQDGEAKAEPAADDAERKTEGGDDDAGSGSGGSGRRRRGRSGQGRGERKKARAKSGGKRASGDGSGGGRKRSSRSGGAKRTTKKGGKSKEKETADSSSPQQRHPEDVEDMFDW